jgi:hypothetical protein
VALAVTSTSVSAPTIAGRDSSQASDTWYGSKPPLLAQPLDGTADLQVGVGEPGPTKSPVPGELPFFDLHAGQQPAMQRANGTMDSPNC